MHTNLHSGSNFPVTIWILLLIYVCSTTEKSFSLVRNLNGNSQLTGGLVIRNMMFHAVPGKLYNSNFKFTIQRIMLLFSSVLLTWLYVLLLQAGDVHPNPGPSSNSSSMQDLPTASSVLNNDFSSFANHLSFVHYNVQSLAPKLDTLAAELMDFDILAFSETWLNESTLSEGLLVESFSQPERKDRVDDRHGGVIIYVKDSLFYRRRDDLELRGIENIWIKITIKHKRILLGLIYRPPSSDSIYYSRIEDSIHFAVDTGINDIIITDDFNFNMLNIQPSRKISSLCEEFSLTQMITESTHYTETSTSLIDIILFSNHAHVISSGVGDPFLHQDIRYHCPVFGILNFSKPKRKSFTRRIWRYDQGNYNLLRENVASTDWNVLINDDINTYAKGLIDKLLHLAEDSIPNKVITIRPTDPPWITTQIKRLIRKRKRAYRNAKRTQNPSDWYKFKQYRNKVISAIRESKQVLNDHVAEKLKSSNLSSKQ